MFTKPYTFFGSTSGTISAASLNNKAQCIGLSAGHQTRVRLRGIGEVSSLVLASALALGRRVR